MANNALENLDSRHQKFMGYVKKQIEQFEAERRQILEEERHKKQLQQENFLEDLKKEIANDYDMSLEQAKILVDQAWIQGHSFGFQEVRIVAQEYGEWVEKILDIQRKIDY